MLLVALAVMDQGDLGTRYLLFCIFVPRLHVVAAVTAYGFHHFLGQSLFLVAFSCIGQEIGSFGWAIS